MSVSNSPPSAEASEPVPITSVAMNASATPGMSSTTSHVLTRTNVLSIRSVNQIQTAPTLLARMIAIATSVLEKILASASTLMSVCLGRMSVTTWARVPTRKGPTSAFAKTATGTWTPLTHSIALISMSVISLVRVLHMETAPTRLDRSNACVKRDTLSQITGIDQKRVILHIF